MATPDYSIVEYFPGNDGHRCGYCGANDTNCSHGMWAHTMTVEDYEQIVSRGWRRSGMYCYKPTLNIACCPMQTIRMDVPNFNMSKSQKKVIKMVNRYLIHGIKRGDRSSDHEASVRDLHHHETKHSDQTPSKLDASDLGLKGRTTQNESSSGSTSSDTHKTESTVTTGPAEEKQSGQTKSEQDVVTTKKSRSYKPGLGPDPNKPKCRKAKEIRIEKRQKKLASGLSISSDQTDSLSANNITKSSKGENEHKSLEEYLSEPDDAGKVEHKLEVKLLQSCPMTRTFLESYHEAYTVYFKYQTTIHGDPPSKPTEKQYKRFLVDSPLQIKLVRSCPPSEDFRSTYRNESYQLFKKYQMTVHKEPEHDCKLRNFSQFLVESPLQHIPPDEKMPSGYGSFHQHYILDGKIIAVGVIDILPHSVSSVYLYYDPDYSFLSLGTYSALREIAFVRELYKSSPDLRYYNMGFYIHSCKKMRYKGQYSPSYIACPEVHTWVPIEKCRPKMDAARYCRLEDDLTVEDEEGKIDLDAVQILQSGTKLSYDKYHALNPSRNDQAEVEEYAKLVGRTCSQRMLLYRR